MHQKPNPITRHSISCSHTNRESTTCCGGWEIRWTVRNSQLLRSPMDLQTSYFAGIREERKWKRGRLENWGYNPLWAFATEIHPIWPTLCHTSPQTVHPGSSVALRCKWFTVVLPHLQQQNASSTVISDNRISQSLNEHLKLDQMTFNVTSNS